MTPTVDIRVRKGAGRPHRVNAALDRLRERQDPTTLRVVVQANLPRGQARPSRLEYQRVTSWLVDCRTPEAVQTVLGILDKLIASWDGCRIVVRHRPTADTGATDGQRASGPERQG
jgi:hypothetical protein